MSEVSAITEFELSPRRERKRRAVRDAILDVAAQLFVEQGYGETRIDSIASRTHIAVGTVYNHFTTKTDILVEILLVDVAEVLEKAQPLVENPEPHTVRAVAAVATLLVEKLSRRPRILWRQLIGQTFIEPRLGAEYASVRRVFVNLMHTLLQKLQEQQALHPRCDLELLAHVSFGIVNTLIYQYIRDDTFTLDDFRTAAMRQLEALYGT